MDATALLSPYFQFVVDVSVFQTRLKKKKKTRKILNFRDKAQSDHRARSSPISTSSRLVVCRTGMITDSVVRRRERASCRLDRVL